MMIKIPARNKKRHPFGWVLSSPLPAFAESQYACGTNAIASSGRCCRAWDRAALLAEHFFGNTLNRWLFFSGWIAVNHKSLTEKRESDKIRHMGDKKCHSLGSPPLTASTQLKKVVYMAAFFSLIPDIIAPSSFIASINHPIRTQS